MHPAAIFRPLLLLAIALHAGIAAADTGRFVYPHKGESYPYSIKQTGENYTFEFEKNPGVEGRKLRAALHVLHSAYGDDSINPSYSETFMKEGATCFVFAGSFYTYRACFLPNDYSPGNANRFWGFVSRLPNAMWIITRNLLPLAVAIGLFFLYSKKKKT